MGAYDSSLGFLLAGTWANTLLFSFEIYQLVKFLRDRDLHRLYIQIAVLIIVVSDVLCTLFEYASVYLYNITNWGDLTYLEMQHYPLAGYLVTTGFTALVVQHSLIGRVYIFSQRKVCLISLFLSLTALTGFGGCVWVACTAMMYPRNTSQDRTLAEKPTIIWLVMSAAADIGISMALIFRLMTMRTAMTETKHWIRRMITAAFSTGALTSLHAAVTLAVYLVDKDSNISLFFAFFLGRTYTLTMLYNVNTQGTPSPAPQGICDHKSDPEQPRSCCVHVTRTVHIADDEGKITAAVVTGEARLSVVPNMNDKKSMELRRLSLKAPSDKLSIASLPPAQ